VLAYQSAWLRHYYGAEYYAALLNNQPMGFYAPHVLIGDARRHKLQVLRVSINSSGARCLPRSSEQLMLGFQTVRGIGEDLALAIVAERDANGAYRSLPDLLRRTGMPRAAAEHLITIGALAEFGLGRRELLWQLGLLIPPQRFGQPATAQPPKTHHLVSPAAPPPPPSAYARSVMGTVTPTPESVTPSVMSASQTAVDGTSVTASRESVTRTVMAASHNGKLPKSQRTPQARVQQLALALPTEHDMVSLPDMSDWERMVADYGLLGLSPSYHPLRLLRSGLSQDILSAEQVRLSRDGEHVRAAGMVVCRQRPGTAKGFVFLLLEDETGLVNVVVRPDLYEKQRSVIRGESYLCVEGTVQLHSGTLNLIAISASPLNQLIGRSPESTLPRAPERNGVPGNPHDKREAASAELAQATPASRDFH
jgi:error-prone DNA polymerase